jgi:hypothetical protein
MPDNCTQLGRVPSESSLGNHRTETNIDQILTIGIVTMDPSLQEVATTAVIVVDGTRQVPNITVQNNQTTRQLARRRRRQRRRQRQRDRQQDMIHQQRQRQRQRQNWMPVSPPQNRSRRDYIPEQRIPRRVEEAFWNRSSQSPTDEIVLDAYDLERTDPRERWEQEQLHEFEGFVVLEHLQRLTDEIEQTEHIGAEQQLLQLEQNDHVDFFLHQINQPLSYDQ